MQGLPFADSVCKTMTEKQADAEARRLNAELGRAGTTNAYYHAREVKRGRWDVVRVDEKPKSFLRSLLVDSWWS